MYHFTISTTAEPEYRQHLQDILQAHNQRVSSICGSEATSLQIRLTNDNGNLVGAHQALGFYQKYGYSIIGSLADYPDGHTLYWLRKEL
jgi:ribosomal protein S18 acetylase RimI-like enzyme